MLKWIDRYLAVAILVLNGWMFTLPVSETPLPIWFTPIQVVHGVFLHQFLLLLYVVFFAVVRKWTLPASAVRFAALIAALAFLGVMSSGANLRPAKEFAAAGRYLLLAAYFIVAVDWARRYKPTFLLRNLVLGMAAAGAVNLYYTFTLRSMALGGLPLLLGQNGPGGYLGISVPLSAWLMAERRNNLDAYVALSGGAIGVVAAAVSYSKLAMLMAAAGAVGWWFVIGWNLVKRSSRRVWAAAALGVVVLVALNWSTVTDFAVGARRLFELKFVHVDTRSLETRAQYYLIAGEILVRHPVFGVGYGGFYDAVLETEAHKSPWSAEESAEAGAAGASNPHNSFLFYMSANGVGGVFVCAMLFVVGLGMFWEPLAVLGAPGKILWLCLASSFFVFGSTLPTLFNTSIFYLPVAFALSCSDRLRSASHEDDETALDLVAGKGWATESLRGEATPE